MYSASPVSIRNLVLTDSLTCESHRYCVGTRRKSLLTQTQIDECTKVLELEQIPQFETRMVAEVKLYWIIYTQCCAARLNLTSIRASLSAWKRDWNYLFGERSFLVVLDPSNEFVATDQPRSQFLQMGHHFAFLLTHCRSVQSKTTSMRSSTLTEMVQLCRNIINLAIDNTDERTSHLTDHIYHILTFSAITLCQLLQTYRGKLGGHDVETSLDTLVLRLVDWLHSIGFPCHVSRVLGDVITAYYARLNPPSRAAARRTLSQHEERRRRQHQDQPSDLAATTTFPPYGLSVPSAPTTPMVSSYTHDGLIPGFDQDFSWTACFDFDAGAMEWPQYEESTDGGSGSAILGIAT